jgi:hypothetical protein
VAWIFSARHDAHPFGGMFFVGIGWPNHLNNTLSYSGYCRKIAEGNLRFMPIQQIAVKPSRIIDVKGKRMRVLKTLIYQGF